MDRPENRTHSFLAACHATSRRNRTLEAIRDRGAETVLAVFRLVKNALVHSTDNRSAIGAANQCADILNNFGVGTASDVTLTFSDGVAFICGELVRGSRELFDCVSELDQLFAVNGISEIVFSSGVSTTDLLALAGALAKANRSQDQPGSLLDLAIEHIALRSNEKVLERRDNFEELPKMEEALRIYAGALVTLRRICDAVAEGKGVPLPRVKRIAQSLVSLSERSEIALLALTTVANAHRDDAGRALQTAILTIAIGRQLTDDSILLSQLAMAALLGDVGRLRLGGRINRDRLVPLSESAESVVPSQAVDVCITSGGVNLQNALRTVMVYETNCLERESHLGTLYNQERPPLLVSEILLVARTFMDYLAPRDTSLSMSPAAAIGALTDAPGIDPDLVKLLIAAVGVHPVGTVVRLDTREVAVVVGPSSNRSALDKPRVRMLTDSSNRLIGEQREIDLGVPPVGRRQPRIVGIVEPGESKLNVAAIVVGAVSTTRS